jgi:F420-non-reducing hydrogenase iron-sulfur subunit
MTDHHEPRIVAFFCNWCTYIAADTAGVARKKYPHNVHIVRLICSGRLDPQFVVAALKGGADGVLIGGCHPKQCHYSVGNYKALRRHILLGKMLEDFGIEKERVRLEWISASESDKLQRVIHEFVDELKALGPLDWPGRLTSLNAELEVATGE